MAAVIKGISFIVSDPEKTTPFKQARITGTSFLVVPRTLTVKVLAWNGAGYIPVSGAELDVVFTAVTSRIVTNEKGEYVLNFEENQLTAVLLTVPEGYRILDYSYTIDTVAKNYMTYILYPADMKLTAYHWEQIL